MDKCFNELSLEEMLNSRDWWSERSSDHRAWKSGEYQRKVINSKIEELGGWNEEIVSIYNKYAPEEMQINSKEFLTNIK